MLQRRLHGLLVEAAIKRLNEEAELDGSDAYEHSQVSSDDEFMQEVEANYRAKRTMLYELFGTDSEGSSNDA